MDMKEGHAAWLVRKLAFCSDANLAVFNLCFTNENIYFESYYDEQRKFRMNHIAYNMLILVITKS
jgi:hypothetical protein